jgi:hypothetical protein
MLLIKKRLVEALLGIHAVTDATALAGPGAERS